jgi:lysophospholipase L1-like esterase
VRNLWFRLAQDLPALSDVYQACLLIGANDVGNASPLDLFEDYYRQVLHALQVGRFRVVFCADIPPIRPDGHAFFSAESETKRNLYNERIREVIADSPIAHLVDLSDLSAECFTDPVHLSETGNREVAERFARSIMAY